MVWKELQEWCTHALSKIVPSCVTPWCSGSYTGCWWPIMASRRGLHLLETHDCPIYWTSFFGLKVWCITSNTCQWMQKYCWLHFYAPLFVVDLFKRVKKYLKYIWIWGNPPTNPTENVCNSAVFFFINGFPYSRWKINLFSKPPA